MIEEILKSKPGFIAALDQSGGSSAKTLALYGITPDMYQSDEMLDKIDEMRKRIITNEAFSSDYIIAVILFKHTMANKIGEEYVADYLLNKKNIYSFLKIDVGLEEQDAGVQMLKSIPDLEGTLEEAKKYHIVGTKMRSVIHEYNEYGIKKLVEQQFKLAKVIMSHDLIPIIEPEVSIDAKDKERIENYLKEVVRNELLKLKTDKKLLFKFTLPSKANLYNDLLKYKNVLRIVALSGGYPQEEACQKLQENKKMIASFSRAFLENLKVSQSEEEFTNTLKTNINNIYIASKKKV